MSAITSVRISTCTIPSNELDTFAVIDETALVNRIKVYSFARILGRTGSQDFLLSKSDL